MLYRRIKHVNKNKNIHPFGPVWSNDVNESRVFRVSYRRLKGKEEVQTIVPKTSEEVEWKTYS